MPRIIDTHLSPREQVADAHGVVDQSQEALQTIVRNEPTNLRRYEALFHHLEGCSCAANFLSSRLNNPVGAPKSWWLVKAHRKSRRKTATPTANKNSQRDACSASLSPLTWPSLSLTTSPFTLQPCPFAAWTTIPFPGR